MLQYLRIKNLALLSSVELEFLPGFTAVTGETGAGKSVLLGALSLLSGARADKTIIKQGAEACEIEAVLYFEDTEVLDRLLESLELPGCEEGALVLKRTVPKAKAQKIMVNGSLATLSALQALGQSWIDFHGPGEPQKLFHEHYQLGMLDLYAGLGKELEHYKTGYQAWRATLKRAEELASAEQLSEDEAEFIQSQIDKIDAVNPTEESIAELEQNFKIISQAEEIRNRTSAIWQVLGGHNTGVIAQLQEAHREAHFLDDIEMPGGDLKERILSLIVEAEDIASDVSHLQNDSDMPPSKVQQVEKTMALWLELLRQYGPSTESVIAKRAALFERLSSQGNIEAALAKIYKEAKEQESGLKDLAAGLAQKRKKAAKAFTKKVEPLLKSLGFKHAQFNIRIEKEKELKAHGDTKALFEFAPNAGQALMPLNKIASSGETARVMLALKAILAEVDHTPLLVFDEVDANVGGEIATHVAGELAKLSENHQVFCITHLPQVASQAQNHFLVNKVQTKDTTAVEIGVIESAEGRLEEIARMLGDRNSKAAKSHAEELLGVAAV